jgi:hypothetical protein
VLDGSSLIVAKHISTTVNLCVEYLNRELKVVSVVRFLVNNCEVIVSCLSWAYVKRSLTLLNNLS